MIITLNISRKELEAIKRNDMRALTTFADLVRYVVAQGVGAMETGERFEYFTVVSPPIPIVEDTNGALCVPHPEAMPKQNTDEPQAAATEIPDVFKRMIWEEGEGDSNEA